ncbi:MAG TPA: ATP-binding protein [Micromonosporaceae bacterium]
MAWDAFAPPPTTIRELSLDTLTAIRTLVAAAARDCGLDEDRTHNFAVAVDEAMTNAIRYATGAEVSISAENGAWVGAEIRDRGPGIPAGTSAELPPPGAVTGRGLWLMHNLCDQVDIDTGPQGTVVRLVMLVNND